MKKNCLVVITLAMLLFSCKYDYNELDISKAYLLYHVVADQETKKLISNDIEKSTGYKASIDDTKDWRYGVEEYDIDGKLLYRGMATRRTQGGTRSMNVYDSLKTISPFKGYIYIPWIVLKRNSGVLEVSPKTYDLSLNNSRQYTTEIAPDSLWRYQYLLKCTYGSLINKCNELGYKIADTEYYNEEQDKNGNVIVRRKQEQVISFDKAVDVVSFIDVFGWKTETGYTDYNNKVHVMQIRFSPQKIKDIAGKQITLKESDPHTIDIYVKGYRYWLDFSCYEMYSKLSEYGYEISDAQYFISEFDTSGNLIRTREKPKSSSSDKWLISAENAATVQGYIDVYGWKYRTDGSVDYSSQVKVFTITFNKLLLENIKDQQISLTESNPHTYIYYVEKDNTIRVTGVSLNTSATQVKVGYQITLTATITPSNATNKSVSWTSSNTSVATVTSGKVKGISEGVAVITCKTNDGGYTATCQVTVTSSGSSTTKYTVSVSSNNTTMGTVAGGGQYASGSTATVTATAKSGYEFTQWSDGSKANPYSFTVTKNVSLTAYFAQAESSSNTIFWNFSDPVFKSLGTIMTSTTINGLTIAASGNKMVTIDSYSISYDGISFTHRLKLNGTGAYDARHVHFTVDKACTIEIYASSANSNSTRTMNVDTGSFGSTVKQYSLDGNISKSTYNYTGSGEEEIYIYSANNGINLYGIRVIYR